MKQSTRPPAQYVTAPGTQFRLIPNDYDKNTYGQCNYASYRTLVRCKQIRSKEELARNDGRCEEHGDFSKLLEENHKKEVMRCHAENDSKMQRRRFEPWIASNDFISDEEDYLQPIQSVPSELPDSINDNILDNHPLRYAEHFTDKDILKIKMDLVQKDIDDLREFKRLVTSRAQREHELMGDDDEKDGPSDMAQRRVFKASARYARGDYLTLTTVDPVYNQCCVGPNMDDGSVISHIVHSLLDALDNFHPIPIDKKCTKPALHLSKYCIEHVTLDRRQKMFGLCTACGVTAIGGNDPKCTFHMKSHAVAEMVALNPPEPTPASTKTTKRSAPTRHDFNISLDDEDTSLANLSRIETMVSPMQQFAPPAPSSSSSSNPPPPSITSNIRRYQGPPAQLLRPPQMGPPPGSSPSKSALRAMPLNPFIRQRVEEPSPEDEALSQTCARVRPLDPNQFGSGKRPSELQRLHQRPSPSTISPYQLQKKVPSIISPSGPSSSSHLTSPGRVPYQGWRHSSQGAHRAQPPATRFPVQQTRQQQPKTIPLERVQEPVTINDILDDQSPMRYPGPEPTRRGVPYYKNASFRRSAADLPTRHVPQPYSPGPSSSPISHHPPPPVSPQPYRPQASRLPMAPHRAIAAGINPADMGTAVPRPTYRLPAARPLPTQQLLAQQQIPLMTTSITPPVRRAPQMAPHRLVGAGGTPTKVTTSYTVVGTTPPSGAPSTSGNSSQSPSSLTISALDTARHDARFANMNVKTFLAMGNKDFSSMTQEEIDLLSAAPNTLEKSNKKGSGGQKNAQKGPSAPILSPQTMETLDSPQKLENTSTPPPKIVRKRKIEEVPVEKSVENEEETAPVISPQEEPASKKLATPAKSVEKETPKAPKLTPAKRSTPTPSTSGISSGRTPRAAAIVANQAISHQKPPNSASSSAPSASTVSADPENPLDLLAQLAADEEMSPISKKTPKRSPPKSSQKKNPKKASREEEEEYEEEL